MKKIIVAVMLVFVSVVLGGSFVGCGKKKAEPIAGVYYFESVSRKINGVRFSNDHPINAEIKKGFEGSKITLSEDGSGSFSAEDEVEFIFWEETEEKGFIVIKDENYNILFEEDDTIVIVTVKNKILTITMKDLKKRGDENSLVFKKK